MSPLREPNETHLGLSQKKAQGRGLGSELANEVWKLLSESNAVKTGLLVDLEDTALLINKIGPDIISDITTNVIRGQLITFTQNCCRDFNIPMAKGVDSGALWDPVKKLWYSEPNAWAKAVKSSADNPELTDVKLKQLKFWDSFKEYAKSHNTKLRFQKSHPVHWTVISIDSSNCSVSLTINSRDKLFGCELYIHDNKDLFNQFLTKAA